MDSIKINITLPKASELRADLNGLLDQVKNKSSINLDLDITSFKASISEVSQLLGKLKSQVSILGGFESLINANIVNQSTSAIEKQNNAIREQQKLLDERVLKTSFTTQVGNDGEDILIKDLEKIKDEYGNIIEVVNTYSKKTGEITSTIVTTTNEVEKQRLENEKLLASTEKVKDALQFKLNNSVSNKNFTLIDDSVFTNLQQRINQINTETPEREIRELKIALSNLGSSDSQIVRLQNAISKYGITIDGLKNKYGKIVPEKELDEAVSKVNVLKQALENLQNGQDYTTNAISNILNDASSGVKSLTTATKNASEQQRLYNKEVTTFGNAFKDILTKVGLFSIVYTGINKVQNALRDGVQSVIDMDTALADLNKVVDLSDSQILSMRDSAVAMGEALGRSAIDVAKAQAEFGRQYKDIETINEMTRASILGANVMDGVSSADVAKGLTTIITSMKLEAEDAIPILDSLNEVQNNYRVSASNMLSALAEVGSTAKIAGADIYELQGYITAMTVSTGKSGDEIGNSLRSITSRIYKIGSEGIQAEGKPEKMLQDMGVAVRDLEGNFRPLNEILSDLNIKWKTMTDTQKIGTAQVVAGVHRYNDFISLMNNFEMAIDSSATAMNSMGSATKENEIYLNSIEGKMKSLKATTQGFWFDFISSDMIKGGVDALQSLMNILDGLQNTFGSLGLTVGTLSAGFLMFTNNPLRQFADDIVKHKTTLGGLSDILNQVKAKVAETGTSMNVAQKSSLALRTGFDLVGNSAIATQIKVIALQTVLSLGLSAGITLVVSGITKLVSSLNSSGKSMEDVKTQSDALAGSLDNVSKERDLTNQYESISKQLKDANLEENKRNDLKKQLDSIMKDLIASEQGYYGILNDENLTLDQQIAKMEQIRNTKLFDTAKDLDKDMMSQGDIETKAQRLREYIQTYKDIQSALTTGAETGNYQKLIDLIGVSDVDEANQILGETKNKINELDGEIIEYNSGMELFKDANYETSRSLVSLDNNTNDFISTLNKSTEALDENTKAKENNFGIKQTQMSNDDALANYSDSINKVEEYMGILDQLNEKQAVTPKLMKSLIDTFPEITKLGSGITNVAKVQEYLNSEIAKQEDIARTSYQAMMEYNEDYYNGSIKNTESWQNYLVDVMNTLKDINADYYNKNAEGMSNELRNANSLAQARGTIETNLVNSLAGLWSNYYKTLSNQWYTDRPVYQYASGKGTALYEETNKILSAQNEMAKKAQEMLDRLNGFSAGISVPNIGGNFIGSSSGSGSSGSKATEKEVADLEDLTNRYHDLEDAVNDYSNALKINKLLQENSTGTTKINLMKEELGLYQKQSEAVKKLNEEQKREANELKSMLAKQGVSFDNKGDIGNYNAILTSKRNWANSLSGDAKESAKEQVKALVEQLKRYDELVNKLIPAQEDEWQSLNNTIKEVYKTQAKLVADQEKQIYDTIKYFAERATEAKKKEIDKQIELLNKSYDDENKDENLNKQRQKVTELMNEMAKYENSVDAKGKARYQQLVEEYEAQQSELNNIIKESQKEFMLSSMEKEKEKLDEELENLLSPANMNKLIADALNSGMVEIGGEVVDLQKAMTSMLTETTIGTQTLIQTNNEWIASLKEAISLYSNISGINSNIGLNTSINGLNGARGVDSRTFNINVSVPEVAGGVTGDDVSKAITKALKDYDSKFK